MRLVDLDPNWVQVDGRSRCGITFVCPTHGDDHRVGVPFENPVDGLGPSSWRSPANAGWHREGESFEDLTLSPSINVHDHWHGWITKGEVRNA